MIDINDLAVQYAKTHSDADLEVLCARGVRWVYGIANRVWTGGMSVMSIDDIIGEGNIAMVQAAKRYDPTRGKFTFYASRMVRGAMMNAIERFGGRAYGSMRKRGSRGVSIRCAMSLDQQVANHGSKREPVTLAECIPADQPSVESVAMMRAAESKLPSALSRLPARERACVIRARLLNESEKVVAEHVGISKQRVNQLIHASLKRLAEDAELSKVAV